MKINFIDSGHFVDAEHMVSDQMLSEPLETRVRSSSKHLSSIKDINYLESQITRSVQFHAAQRNFPKHMPDEIDVIFTEKSVAHNWIGMFTGRQKAARASVYHEDRVNVNKQKIYMSLDIANSETVDKAHLSSNVVYERYNDYTNKLKLQIRSASADIPEVARSRYVQTIFLHELAHTCLNKLFRKTIFLEHFKRDEITNDPVAQFAANVAEGFCDGFAGLFMTKHILEQEKDTAGMHFVSDVAHAAGIIDAMSKARNLALDYTPPGSVLHYTDSEIYAYDFSALLEKIKNDAESLVVKTPDAMLNNVLTMACEHAKKLNDSLITSKPGWKLHFESKLNQYMADSGFVATTADINQTLDTFFFKPAPKQLNPSNKNNLK
ncbi:hypothetical protein [Paraburkholderia tropica]|uniref:hypothetical protein n=1 Tax=Paraburkholderia tropica TaxID=92647 RepID=UPI003D2C3CBB